MVIKILLLLLLIPGSCWADPFIYSNSYSTGVDQPTHCYIYVDGEATASLQSTVGLNSDGSVYCRVNLKAMTTGIHTAQMSAVIEVAGVSIAESTKTVLTPITKDACSDATLCEYKYQFAGAIIWYK